MSPPPADDTLNLGSLVFNDLNRNSAVDSGTETGIDGVALTLYADDGTTVGSFDAGDTQIATATTMPGTA